MGAERVRGRVGPDTWFVSAGSPHWASKVTAVLALAAFAGGPPKQGSRPRSEPPSRSWVLLVGTPSLRNLVFFPTRCVVFPR